MVKILLVILLSIIGCVEDDDGPYTYRKGNDDVILILGDSRADMGADWKWLPQTIVNFGKSGSTTNYIIDEPIRVADGLHIRYSLVIIFAGINDRNNGISPEQFRYNLIYILTHYREQGIQVALMDMTQSPETADMTDQYRLIMEEFDEYVPISYEQRDFIDGCHLSLDGYEFVSTIIQEIIKGE